MQWQRAFDFGPCFAAVCTSHQAAMGGEDDDIARLRGGDAANGNFGIGQWLAVGLPILTAVVAAKQPARACRPKLLPIEQLRTGRVSTQPPGESFAARMRS